MVDIVQKKDHHVGSKIAVIIIVLVIIGVLGFLVYDFFANPLEWIPNGHS